MPPALSNACLLRRSGYRVLVRYERDGMGMNSGPSMLDSDGQEYRYVEVYRDICVLPSVSIAPSISPSYSMPGECVLSLNVSNYRTDGEPNDRSIQIHKVSPVRL